MLIHTSNLGLIWRTVAVLLLALSASCGGGSGSESAAVPVSTESSATLDANGGTVVGPDGTSLSVPAEALDTPMTLRIARDSIGAPALVGMNLLSPIYAVTPHGTAFTSSALLQLPFDASKIPPGSQAVVLRGEPDGTWHVQPLTSTQPGIAAVDVSSLSWYAVGVCTPGDAGVFGFGTGDCPANSTLKLEYRDGNGSDIPVSRDANGLALPFPEITTPTDVTVHLMWERPAGVNREDNVFLNGGLGWLLKGEVVNQQMYSRDFQVHLDPTALPGAAKANGTVARVFATVQYCRNVPVFGVGNQDVCWSFDADIAFRVHDTNPAPDAPVITEQPANASVIAGQRATYRVSATAPHQLYTQWQRFNATSGKWQAVKLVTPPIGNGISTPSNSGAAGQAAGPAVSSVVDNSTPGNLSSIVNGTQSFWLVPDASDAGAQFRALVCDGFASGNRTCVYSNAAQLDYLVDGKQPWWTLEPADTHVPAGTTASFTVNANGYYLAPSVAIHVKTPAGSESILACPYAPGSNHSTSCTVTTGALSTADNGTIVWAEAWIDQAKTSIITSSTATLTVGGGSAAPSISNQPTPAAAVLGGTASFSVGAGGTAPLSYQWRFNGTPLTDHAAGSGTSGVTGSGAATLSLSNVQSADVGNYSVVVSNGTAPDATSNSAALTTVAWTYAGTHLAMGRDHACAVKMGGTVACWGSNFYGQLGTTPIFDNTRPTVVANLTNVVSVAAGFYHSCAVKADGTVACWGNNTSEQLGDGTFISKTVPTAVPGLTGVVAVAGGQTHTCAAKSDGSVLCWGANTNGELGTGFMTGHAASPTAVPNLTGVVALKAGMYHTCALKSDGTVSCWGANNQGQLGDGTGNSSPIPVVVPGLGNVVALGGGAAHNCALKSDGSVLCWGLNAGGEIGDGTVLQRDTPTLVPGLSGVTSLAANASAYHSCASRVNGTVACWGFNNYGQVGDGTLVDRLVPTDVPGLTGVASVQVGITFSCAARQDGSLVCWGANTSGSLGDGSIVDRPTPTAVLF